LVFDLGLGPASQSALIIKIELNGKMTDRLQIGNVDGKEKWGEVKAGGGAGRKYQVEEMIEKRKSPF
jgi:hypothetical protein